MRGKSGLFTSKLALVGMLAVAAFLIYVLLGEREAATPSTPMSPPATAGGVTPAAEDAGQIGSAEISESLPDSPGQSAQVGSLKRGESVNPTIDRYGVPVSESLPVVPGAHRDPQTSVAGSPESGVVDQRNLQTPEASAAQNGSEPSQGPGAGASNTGNVGMPPEGLNPQMSGQAPEAFDPGLPMLPPEASDAGIYGPGPGELENGVNGPGPGELENGVPATPPDEQ